MSLQIVLAVLSGILIAVGCLASVYFSPRVRARRVAEREHQKRVAQALRIIADNLK